MINVVFIGDPAEKKLPFIFSNLLLYLFTSLSFSLSFPPVPSLTHSSLSPSLNSLLISLCLVIHLSLYLSFMTMGISLPFLYKATVGLFQLMNCIVWVSVWLCFFHTMSLQLILVSITSSLACHFLFMHRILDHLLDCKWGIFCFEYPWSKLT